MFMNKFSQRVTYWAPVAGDDGFGKGNLAAPIVVKARWDDKRESTVDVHGMEIVSKAVIYTPDSTTLEVDGYAYLGVSKEVNPRTVDGAFKIVNVGRIPDLRNLQAIRTAIL